VLRKNKKATSCLAAVFKEKVDEAVDLIIKNNKEQGDCHGKTGQA